MIKKILVAEDDHFLASAYKMKLTKSGFEVKLASDGVEALAELEKFTPDLLILDLVMPNKDGFEVLSEINKNSKWQKLPIIVASNLGQHKDFEKAKALGAHEFIVKSDLSLDDLIEKITKLLN